MEREEMMGIGQGHLERGFHLNARFNTTKYKVIFQEKRNPFIKGSREYQRKQWLLEGFSSCKI